MSSFRNALPRREHRERAQLHERRKLGLLEKHKDYKVRADVFHRKEATIRKLKEKAAFRNPDEFYFKMVNTKTVNGVHKPKSEANKYTQDELMLMKTQDIGYVLQKLQSEKKKIERLSSALHDLDKQPTNRHVYFAEDREEAREIQASTSENNGSSAPVKLPARIKKKMTSSYKELEARKKRAEDLTRIYMEMALKRDLQKPGRKRKLFVDVEGEEEKRPVFVWQAERKR